MKEGRCQCPCQSRKLATVRGWCSRTPSRMLTKEEHFENVSFKFLEDFLTSSPGVDLRSGSAKALLSEATPVERNRLRSNGIQQSACTGRSNMSPTQDVQTTEEARRDDEEQRRREQDARVLRELAARENISQDVDRVRDRVEMALHEAQGARQQAQQSRGRAQQAYNAARQAQNQANQANQQAQQAQNQAAQAAQQAQQAQIEANQANQRAQQAQNQANQANQQAQQAQENSDQANQQAQQSEDQATRAFESANEADQLVQHARQNTRLLHRA